MAVYAVVAVVFLFLPRSTYSQLEKRELAKMPEFSTDKLGGSGVIPWQSYPKMIDKRYMKNGRSDTPCS